MAQMDYFRRPRLSGNVLSRLAQGTIHGSVRRHDADINSNVPYFPTLTSGMSLNILIDGTNTYIASFSDSGFLDAINAINTALGVHGNAFDSDGSISIATATAGGVGSVEVTGGTAAIILGFGVNGTGVRSSGGDLLYTPEDRIGNESITAFQGPHEALSKEGINRAIGRVASNTDVLFSEHLRDRAAMQKITGTTVSSDGTYITLPASTRAFTGYGLLTNASVKEDLAPFFMVIDPASKTPAAAKPVALVRGVPSGNPPYANSPSFGDTSGKNVLGLSLAKVSSVSITAIQFGRYVTCSGTTFTASVVPGDVAQIAGATNSSPMNNNGLKWVVEEVVSDTILNLRPMSKSELALYGTTLLEAQPLVELNGTISGGQVYGSLSVMTGTFSKIPSASSASDSLNLVVRPPIPAGQSVEVWVAQSISFRAEDPTQIQETQNLLYRGQVTSYRTLPDTILSGLTAVFNSGPNTVTFSAGVLRLDGRIINYPGKTYSNATTTFSLTNGVTTYFWYDPLIDDIAWGTSWPTSRDPADYSTGSTPTTMLMLLATMVPFGGDGEGPNTTFYLLGATKTEAFQSRSITVGSGGQFPDLPTAFNYVNNWTALQGDSISAEGPYSHWDIVVVSNTSIPEIINNEFSGFQQPGVLNAPSVRIIGATPLVQIVTNSSASNSGNILIKNCRNFVLEDISFQEIGQSGNTLISIESGSGVTDVTYRNVTQVGTQAPYVPLSGANFGRVLFDHCTFISTFGMVDTFGTFQSVTMRSCIHNFLGNGVAGMFGSDFQPWSINAPLIIEDCTFNNCSPGNGQPYLVNANGCGTVIINGNTFNVGTINVNIDSKVVAGHTNGNSVFSFTDNTVGGPTSGAFHRAAALTGIGTEARGNVVYVKPENANVAGIQASIVVDNTIIAATPDMGQTLQEGVEAGNLAKGNRITGAFTRGIHSAAAYALIDGNYVNITGTGSQGIVLDSGGTTDVVNNNITSVSNALYLDSPNTAVRVAHSYLNGGVTNNYGTNSFTIRDSEVVGAVTANMDQGVSTGGTITLSNTSISGTLTLNGPVIYPFVAYAFIDGCTMNALTTTRHVVTDMYRSSVTGSGTVTITEGIYANNQFNGNNVTITLGDSSHAPNGATDAPFPNLTFTGNTTGFGQTIHIFDYSASNQGQNVISGCNMGNVTFFNSSESGEPFAISDCYFNSFTVANTALIGYNLAMTNCLIDSGTCYLSYGSYTNCIINTSDLYLGDTGTATNPDLCAFTNCVISGNIHQNRVNVSFVQCDLTSGLFSNTATGYGVKIVGCTCVTGMTFSTEGSVFLNNSSFNAVTFDRAPPFTEISGCTFGTDIHFTANANTGELKFSDSTVTGSVLFDDSGGIGFGNTILRGITCTGISQATTLACNPLTIDSCKCQFIICNGGSGFVTIVNNNIFNTGTGIPLYLHSMSVGGVVANNSIVASNFGNHPSGAGNYSVNPAVLIDMSTLYARNLKIQNNRIRMTNDGSDNGPVSGPNPIFPVLSFDAATSFNNPIDCTIEGNTFEYPADTAHHSFLWYTSRNSSGGLSPLNLLFSGNLAVKVHDDGSAGGETASSTAEGQGGTTLTSSITTRN